MFDDPIDTFLLSRVVDAVCLAAIMDRTPSGISPLDRVKNYWGGGEWRVLFPDFARLNSALTQVYRGLWTVCQAHKPQHRWLNKISPQSSNMYPSSGVGDAWQELNIVVYKLLYSWILVWGIVLEFSSQGPEIFHCLLLRCTSAGRKYTTSSSRAMQWCECCLWSKEIGEL